MKLIDYNIRGFCLRLPQKAFVEQLSKATNYIQQAIDPAQEINGKGFTPQITPDQQQKLILKKPEIIKNSQTLADLQDAFDKLYRGFFDQINLLSTSYTKDLLSTKLQYPQVIKNGDTYEVIAEHKNIAEVIRDSKLFNESDYQEILKKFPNNREIALAAVKQNGYALRYASKTFQNYQEIVLAAVKQNGLALRYASETFQKDQAVVLEAVKQNPQVFLLINNRTLAEEIFKELKLADNKEFIKLLIENEFSGIVRRRKHEIMTNLSEKMNWEGEEKVYFSKIEIKAMRQQNYFSVEKAIEKALQEETKRMDFISQPNSTNAEGLKINQKNTKFTLVQGGTFINGSELPIRDGKSERFTDINKNTQIEGITGRNLKRVAFTFDTKQKGKEKYDNNALLSNEITLSANETLKSLSLLAIRIN